MESQEHNDRLLELLYGELSVEEERQLRREIEEDEQLAEAWRELKATHEEVADQVPDPEPMPGEVRDSILEMASREAEGGPKRRSVDSAEGRGGWGRIGSSGWGRAGISVALMMVVGGAVLYALVVPDGEVKQGVESAAIEAPEAEELAVADEEQPAEPREPEGLDEAEQMADELADQRRRDGEEVARRVEEQEAGEVVAELGASPQVDEPSPRPAEAGREQAPEPEPEPEPDLAGETMAEDDSGYGRVGGLGDVDTGGAAGAGGVVESAPDREARAETDDETESRSERMLSAALEAHEEGDEDRARELIERVFIRDHDEELDEDQLQEARELREELRESEEDTAEESDRDINIMR